MRVLMPARIVDRHVGGNTTYASTLEQQFVSRGIEVGRIPMGIGPVTTMARESLYALGRGREGDVLHYTSDTGPLLPVRQPSVLTVHGVASRHITVARSRRQEWIWRGRVARAIASTDRLITVSESSANDIMDVFGVSAQQLRVIPHGIDYPRFSRRTELSDEVRAALPGRFALYIGNIEPRKNIVALVRAFESETVKNLGMPLVIAGQPAWNAEASQAAIRGAANVVYLGWVSDGDRTALMQQCDLFVFPSLYEGFGFPVLEAMAAGARVLTSRKGSLAEVAGPARQIARLDPAGIADAVIHALSEEDQRRDEVKAGQAWARTFSWSRSADSHVQVYEEAVRRR